MDISVELPALPSTFKDLEAQVVLKPENIPLHILVKPIFKDLYDNDPEFKPLIASASNKEAQNGLVRFDRIMAARKVQDKAKADGNTTVAESKLNKINNANSLIMRKYNITPEARLIQFQITHPVNGGVEESEN